MRSLEAQEFRNLARLEFALPPEGLAIVGDNGHGKTNLLEAMAYLHLLRSVRGAHDSDVVHFGASGFHVRGRTCTPSGAERPASGAAGTEGLAVTAGVRTVSLGFERATRRKRVTLDGIAPERLSDALGAIPSVTFSPSDVEVVRGGPVGRRRYLDVVLATTSRRYLAALQTYRGALRQRNAVLRELARRGASAAVVSTAVSPWEPLLAEAGAVLWVERGAWARGHAGQLAELCAAIGEGDPIELRHSARLPGPERMDWRDLGELRAALATALETTRAVDVRHGATRVGPHRDDLLITLGGRELRVFASAGQQRTVAIALRVLESHTLRDHTGAAPVMLFDDPFAELDGRRTRAILGVLGGDMVGQVVIAVPRPNDIPPEFTRLSRHAIVRGVLQPIRV